MSYYAVEGKTRIQLRELANVLRTQLHLDNVMYFPIVQLLEIMPEYFSNFSYEIVSDDELPANKHAETDIITGHIKIKETVYDRACTGEGRDRMTIAHEIAHFITLCVCGFKLARSFSKPKTFEDPEWQAKCFAGELMIPKHLVDNMNLLKMATACGVSYDAAKYQYSKYHGGDVD